MSRLSEALLQRFYGTAEHPYETFEREVRAQLRGSAVLLDIGCGREAPLLRQFKGSARRLIGIDLVEFAIDATDIELVRGDLCNTGLPAASVDVVMARSVMEHVADPAAAYREIARILSPGGKFIFLTANIWDYASLIAMAVPNRLHPWIVARAEGRAENDVFPTAYKTNSKRAVRGFAEAANLKVERLDYLSQYPNYFMFNGLLFLLATGYEKTVSRIPALAFLQGWILATLSRPKQ